MFDDCAGQNKNRMILRLPMWLVDMEIYKKVQVVFQITDHTNKYMRQEVQTKICKNATHVISIHWISSLF